MAYFVNDKTFTDHPLMDEICYNCKRILKGIVIKNDVLANSKETKKSIENAEMYSIYKRYGKIPLDLFPLTMEILEAFGYSKLDAKAYLRWKNSIPEGDRVALEEFANQYFLDNYFEEDGRFKEENDYYRMLTGLPPYDTGEEYYIYIEKGDIPRNYTNDVDYTKPLHLQDKNLINVLYSAGVIDNYRKKYKGSNYSYMMYLGDRSIDLSVARNANKWDILYMPSVYNLVKDKFTEFYNINKEIYANRSYQEFFSQNGDYYDEMMILIVLSQTFNDMIVDTPEWYIRRDIFDIRSCKYFLESNGVDFFKIIPLKYQIRIVKNLNTLITYKSSNRNAEDILDIFDIKNTKIYKYWLYKKKVNKTEVPKDDGGFDNEDQPTEDPGTGDKDYDFGDLLEGRVPESVVKDGDDYDFNIISRYDTDIDDGFEDTEITVLAARIGEIGDEDDLITNIPSDSKKIDETDRDNIVNTKDKAVDEYELEFIQSGVNESYDDYIKDNRYRIPYDDITLEDKFWDGDLDHGYVKDEILKQPFTIVGTKYMSIDYEVDLSEYAYQMEYMMGLLINSNLNTSDIRIPVPSIDEFSQFNISDLFLLMIVFTNNYNINSGSGNRIRIPDMWYGAPPEIDEKLYDWKKKWFPEFFVRKEGRVNGFNSKLDKDELIKILERRHSYHRFGAGDTDDAIPYVGEDYKAIADKYIHELGVDDFIVPNYNVASIDDLMVIYNTNTECYKILQNAINEASDEDELKYLEYIFQELYTRDFDKEYYTNPVTGKQYNDLAEILKDHNFILYDTYTGIMKETNIETRQDMIRTIMNDIVTTLEYYLSGTGLEYLYGFTATESFTSIIYYIYLMVNFFKSYKVYFLDPYVTFMSKDKMENTAKAIDRISEFKITQNTWDKAFVSDVISGINIQMNIKEEDPIDHEVEQVDIYTHHENYLEDLFADYDYNGGNAEYSGDEAVVIDGGTADESQNVPYKNLNGGRAYTSDIDFTNIDGGSANEYNREYFVIDGGSALHKDDMKTDMFGSQKFNYMIDGGCADGRRFINNTLDLRLIGTELFADVVISPYGDIIELKEDGLYVEKDRFASVAQFNNVTYTLSQLINWIITTGVEVSEDLKVMTDLNAFRNRAQGIADSITYNMEYVNDQITLNGKFIATLRYLIDSTNEHLISEFEGRLNPYMWEEL